MRTNNEGRCNLIKKIEIERNYNTWKHARVTVIFNDENTEYFYIGHDVTDQRAIELAFILTTGGKKK